MCRSRDEPLNLKIPRFGFVGELFHIRGIIGAGCKVFGRIAREMELVEGQRNEKIALKRELGLFSAVSIILAVMIGTKTFLIGRIPLRPIALP